MLTILVHEPIIIRLYPKKIYWSEGKHLHKDSFGSDTTGIKKDSKKDWQTLCHLMMEINHHAIMPVS